MKKIKVSDITIKQSNKGNGYSLSFREKLEVAKLLEKLNVDIIELNRIENVKADTLLIKSICSSVKESIIAVPVGLDLEKVDSVWDALKTANKPRLQVTVPVSDAQMEYVAGKKPAAMIEIVEKLTKACKEKCSDVEFIAVDATRSNFEFLTEIISKAISNGADTVTVCDTAGVFLAEEFGSFVEKLKTAIPELSGVTLGVQCSNTLSVADSSTISAIIKGAGEVKTAVHDCEAASLANTVGIISAKPEALGADCNVKTTQMKRITEQINWMCETDRSNNSPFDNGVQDGSDTYLDSNDDIAAVTKAVAMLGYDLSHEDNTKVFEEFSRIAEKKETVGVKELDAIVASVALQVPPTYRLDSYVINIGNKISATAHMKLYKNGTALEGISLGDGPIDAAFLAIEQIAGQHFELDDFQIKAITEGREAMGESVVKLRNNGKLYSGRGISTDIVGASINAYINALNKIVYEESEDRAEL